MLFELNKQIFFIVIIIKLTSIPGIDNRNFAISIFSSLIAACKGVI